MIDIHTHILPFLDDGSKSIENSLEIIKVCYDKNVREFVFTPHYRQNEYQPTPDVVKKTFEDFSKIVKEKFSDVKTNIGQEVFCDGKIYDRLKNGEIITLNGNNAVLLEFNYTAATDIEDYVYNVSSLGYLPIIAHVERYEYIKKPIQVKKLKENGALIQVNASSLVGKNAKFYKKKVMALLKEGLVDFIASDIHYGREMLLDVAYDFVAKKFSKRVADDLFENNAVKYITSSKN